MPSITLPGFFEDRSARNNSDRSNVHREKCPMHTSCPIALSSAMWRKTSPTVYIDALHAYPLVDSTFYVCETQVCEVSGYINPCSSTLRWPLRWSGRSWCFGWWNHETSFWRRCAAMEVVIKPICACIAFLEVDEATFPAVYAWFLYVKFRLSKLKRNSRYILAFDDAALEQLNTHLKSRLKVIYSPRMPWPFKLILSLTTWEKEFARKISMDSWRWV